MLAGAGSGVALGGGADHAVVAVVVVAGDRRELVAGELGALLVVDGGLLLVAARCSGPSASRVVGVAGQ